MTRWTELDWTGGFLYRVKYIIFFNLEYDSEDFDDNGGKMKK